MYVVVGRIAMLVAAACCAAAVNAATVNSAATEQSATEAEYLASIAHLREQSIKEGKIYDDTLLRFDKLDAYVEHFRELGMNATDRYERYSNLGISTYLLRLYNLAVLAGDPVNSEQIAALLIGKQRAEGTYVRPAEKHLQLYHDFLVDHHGVRPDTASAELDEILGDLATVAPQVLQMREEGPIPPSELYDTNPEYWDCLVVSPDFEWNEETGECNRAVASTGGTSSSSREPAAVRVFVRILVLACDGNDDMDVDIIDPPHYETFSSGSGSYMVQVAGSDCSEYGEKLGGTKIESNFWAWVDTDTEGIDADQADGADVDASGVVPMCWYHDRPDDKKASSTGDDYAIVAINLIKDKSEPYFSCNYGSGTIYFDAWKIDHGVVVHDPSVTLTTATISWDAHSAATDGYDIVLLRGSTTIHSNDTDTTSKTITGLTKGTGYTVKVSVKGVDNTEGTREFSTIGPVRNLLVHSITQNSASAYWDAHTWHNKGYKIELWQDEYPDKTPDTFEQGGITIELTGLTPDTRYTIKVGIQDEAGTEAVAMFATGGDTSPAPVLPVTGVTTSAVWKYVTVSWDQHPDYANPIYTVEVLYNHNSTLKDSFDTTTTTKTFTLPSYEYKIRVGLKHIEDTWSGFVVTNVPADVQGVTVSDKTTTSATISWDEYDFGDDDETATYKIEWRKKGEYNTSSAITTSTSKQLTELSQSTGYQVRVSLNGEARSASGWVNFATEAPQEPEVTPVTGVSVTTTHNKATIVWKEHDDVTSRGYILEVKRDDVKSVYTTVSLSKTLYGLPSDTSYMVRVGLNANYVDEDTFSAWKNFRTDKEPRLLQQHRIVRGRPAGIPVHVLGQSQRYDARPVCCTE